MKEFLALLLAGGLVALGAAAVARSRKKETINDPETGVKSPEPEQSPDKTGDLSPAAAADEPASQSPTTAETQTPIKEEGDFPSPESDKPPDMPTQVTEADEKPQTLREPRKPPVKIQNRHTGESRPRPSPAPDKYELICHNRTGGEWNIFIHLLPAGRGGDFAKTFQQNGNVLEFEDSRCKLTDYSSPIKCEDGEVNTAGAGKPLYIFRFGKDWQGEGGKAGKISPKGHYIVIAPRGYKRIHASPPIAPEDCADENYLAHFFPADEGADGFEENNSFMRGGFFLQGKEIYDNKPEELFSSPPKLEWEGNEPALLTIEKIDNETNEREYIGEAFKPADRTIAEEINGRTGKFCLRIYDEHPKMQERIFFRVTSLLEKILINEVEYTRESVLFPSTDGYDTAEVCFVGKDGDNLLPRLKSQSPHVNQRVGGIFEIKSYDEPYPNGDFARWILEEESGSVEIDIVLPRIWWRYGKNVGGWRYQPPAKVKRGEFRANDDIDVEISVPSCIPYLRICGKGEQGQGRKVRSVPVPGQPSRSLVTVRKMSIKNYAREDSQATELQAAYREKTLSFLVIEPDLKVVRGSGLSGTKGEG